MQEQSLRLGITQEQKLIMTPRLEQSLNILKMGSDELCCYINDEVEKNPLLEIQEHHESIPRYEYRHRNQISGSGNMNPGTGDLEFWVKEDKQTLRDHLRVQLHTLKIDKRYFPIGDYIIENTDDSGYLEAGADAIAGELNIQSEAVDKMIAIIQGFDPAGVCARNLKECILIQLGRECFNKEIINIVEMYFDELMSNKITYIAKASGLLEESIVEILNIIRSLDPKPGRQFEEPAELKYIIPDIVVESINNELVVVLNDDAVPALSISGYYRELGENCTDDILKSYLIEKMNKAQWVLKCIEQRAATLKKIGECIISRQLDFFHMGEDYLKPMTMLEIAEMAGVHESTVSRAVNDKYLGCSWGTYELRSLFTQKIITDYGDGVSSNVIKKMIMDIIRSEDKLKPLSDGGITDILSVNGVGISRRTVAKYRAQAGIPAAGLRKRY